MRGRCIKLVDIMRHRELSHSGGGGMFVCLCELSGVWDGRRCDLFSFRLEKSRSQVPAIITRYQACSNNTLRPQTSYISRLEIVYYGMASFRFIPSRCTFPPSVRDYEVNVIESELRTLTRRLGGHRKEIILTMQIINKTIIIIFWV